MESVTTFEAGMNGDLSKITPHNNFYLEALNFRPQTELGESNGSLVNIKGNECKITYPVLRNIFKLKVINDGGTTNDAVTITVNGQTTGSLTITESTTGIQIYNLLKALPNCFETTNGTPITSTFAISYSDDYVIIYQQPVYTDCGPTGNSTVPTITLTHTSLSKKYTLKFIDKDNTDNDLATPYINTSNNLYTIGSTFIDNDVYLFTSDEVTNVIPDNDSFTGVSAIWKLSINDITKQNTLELLYCNYLDFTIQHPIPPSAITARYESLEVQRIYWSDFYNKIRTINVGDPQLMALDPKLLSITPTTEFSQAVLNQIIFGSLPSGCYQLAYRLKQTLGSISNFSELSNMVYLISPSLSGPFQDYQGSVGNSNKGIEWKIDNIDSSYTQIEAVVLYRSSRFAIPTVKSILTTNVPTNGSITVSYTDPNATSHIDLTIEEYLTLVATFSHAKTVDTKDNRLFWGNVKTVLKDLSDWDSRAFRAKTSGAQDIILTNNGVTSTYQLNNPAGSDYVGNLLETEDTINEYYDSSGNPSSNACYYQPGTPILGGAGINISYTFGTTSILADTNIYIYNDDWRIMGDGKTLPWREMTTDNNNVDGSGNITVNALNDSYKYPQRSSQGSNKYPYKAGLFKGYQHEEIYRFGIQFKDLEGNPFFTKWIGDIKFPSYGDTNLNPDTLAAANGINDFRLSFTTGNLQYLQIMNIQFDVDVSALSSRISGYEIVRVERLDNNKTIWGCGLITPFVGYGDTYVAMAASNNLFLPANFQSKDATFNALQHAFYNPWPSQASMESLNCLEYSNTEKYKSFDCFDHLTGISRPSFQNGDKLLIRGKLKSLNYRKNNAGFMKFFNTNVNGSGGVGTTNPPYPSQQLYNCTVGAVPGGGCTIFGSESTYDHDEIPFYIIKFNHDSTVSGDYVISNAAHIPGNEKITFGSVKLNNCGTDMNYTHPGCGHNRQGDDYYGLPCYGSATTMIEMVSGFTTDGAYGCLPATGCTIEEDIYKLIALYFKYNTNLYGGFSYTSRTNNEYIPCSEYIPVIKNKLSVNLTVTNFKVYGGDVYTSIWDHQKTIKNVTDSPPQYRYFSGLATSSASFNCSTTIFFPCTSMANVEVRDGDHINKSLNTATYSSEDSYDYYDFHSCENNTVKYFPKPLNFVSTNEWQNRVYFSQLKVNNETQDNWSVYETNAFYDVEGNYGGINALISLNNQMYYIQDRGIGLLMINPIAMVDAGIGADVKLGASTETIQKHQYIALDIGTEHQWSVYRSSNQFAFVDVRSKKIFMFDGQSLKPISDINGQRNFVIKRLHDEILTTDNPIISKGILTTYDYYHNEFLFTFLNNNVSASKREFSTIAFSEPLNKFTSHYSFKPNIYINNHKYLWSNVNDTNLLYPGFSIKTNIYLHNYGVYGQFYNLSIQPSTLKILLNESPLYTKVFDNLTWLTESIKDNLEYSDDSNVYPGAITNPSFPDNVNHQLDTFSKLRCYNDWQNTDFVSLSTIKPNNNLTRKERDFNVQIPRNKFNYDGNSPSVSSLFDPSKLTKLTFGERLRDKYIIVDLIYENLINNRFIVNLLKAQFRKSDR